MNFIKKTFLDWKIKKAINLQKNIRRQTLNYDEASIIGVLLKSEDPAMTQAVQNFLQRLAKDHKKVTVVVYHTTSENVINFQFQHYSFTEKEIDNWGSIRSEIVENFILQSFDYLYCISKEEEPVFQYILAKSQAKCRIGKYNPKNEVFFEMMINQKPEQGIDIFIEQALHYTKSITYN
ncbi:MAG: hypothetical protein EAZ08_13555 [Cytophagales bacterium]|nr:MAG: hypothetical protein EAZ08_13555 [Cytophagales bacterium]